jgi:tetratricopeptide (TPR) repeat protein
MANGDRVCRRVREEFDVYLDGELAPRRVRGVERHLAACEQCRRVLAQRRQELAAMGDLSLRTAPDDFTERVMAGLAARPTPTARPAPRLRPRLAYAAAGAALAALGIWLWAALRAPEAPRVVEGNRPAVVEKKPVAPPEADKLVAPPEDALPVVQTPDQPAPRAVTKHPRSAPREMRVPPKPEPTPEPEVIEEETPDPIAIADYRQLGEAYEREGMLEEALEAYEIAATEDESPMTTLAVARVRDKLGDTVSAIECYAEAAFAEYDVIPDEEGSET